MSNPLLRRVLGVTLLLGLALLPALGQGEQQPGNDKGPLVVKAKELTIDGDKETKVEGKLTAQDPRDRVHPKSPCHVYEVKLLEGVHHKIELTSDAFKSFLRLESLTGKELASDDASGGGLNCRIIVRAAKAEVFRIIAASIDGKEGAYVLTINKATAQEAQNHDLLAEADQLSAEMIKLFRQGKSTAAVPLGRKALEIRRKVLGEQHLDTATALNNLGTLLTVQGDYAAARPLLEQALAVRKKMAGEEHPVTAISLDNLGRLLSAQREFAAARALMEQALAIRKKVLGEQHPATAQSLDNLGRLLHAQGDYAAARPYFEQALTVIKKAVGEQHPDTATALNNLGNVLFTQGDFAAARPSYEQALAIRKKVLGEQHPTTAQSLNNLGKVLQVLGQFPAARAYLEQSLAINKKVLGTEHPFTAASLDNLGGLLFEQGEYAAARPLIEQGLAIRKKVFGERHPDTIQSLDRLGVLLQAQGDYVAARPCFEQALTMCKKVLGEQHPDTARSHGSLGSLLQAQGDYAAARPHFERALTICKKALGEQHVDTARALNDLGSLLEKQADYSAARLSVEQALTIRKKLLGELHPHTARSLGDLGSLLEKQGDYAAARPFLEQALAINKKTLGERHAATANSLDRLGQLLAVQGDYPAARPYWEQALAISKKAQGEHHGNTATLLNNLGSLLMQQKDYAAARPYLEEALAITKKTLGELHPDTATPLNNLGNLLQAQEDYAAARRFHEQALAINSKALGEQHPRTAESLDSLGALLFLQRDYTAARPYLEQALAIRKKVLGEQHPHTAYSLDHLGMLLHAQGNSAAAQDCYQSAVSISLRRLELAAAGQSERQQFAMFISLRHRLDNVLNLELSAEQAYASVLALKGTISARQQAIRGMRRTLQQGKDEESLALYRDLEQAARRLATLSLSKPDAKNPARLREELEKALTEVERLERALAAVSRDFRNTLEQRSRTVADVQKALPDDAALIDLLDYRRLIFPADPKEKSTYQIRVAAFVVRKGKAVERVDLGSAKEVADAVTAWRKRYGGGDTGVALRKLTWDKLEPYLKDAKLVLISPDRDSARFPWGALPGKNKGTYLIEERAVAVVPVPRLLPDMLVPANDLAAPPRPSLLVIGDVDFDAPPEKLRNAGLSANAQGDRSGALGHWSRLPGAAAEAAAIEKIFRQRYPDAVVKDLSGPQAAANAVRIHGPSHRYMHFATHGFFAPPSLKSILAESSRPERFDDGSLFGRDDIAGYFPDLLSGLVLAGANRPMQPGHDDGILTARELAFLDLGNVELATLSACETGLGETAGGEGLLGLQRAFQVAGAKTVTASLWKVPDEPTRLLMERFYANLWSDKKMSKLEALRQAQLWMLREGRKNLDGKLRERGSNLEEEMRGRGLDIDPPEAGDQRLHAFYWAAFVLSGDWR